MKIKRIVLMLIIVFSLCGCKGDDIRDLRSIGFTIDNLNFKCDFNNVKYIFDGNAVLEDGTLYELSLKQIYQNGSNCKLVDNGLKVKSVYNNEIFKASDNKLYSFNHSNGSYYDESDDKVASFLLEDDSIIKVINSEDDYYVLRDDGNVYLYKLAEDDNDYYLSSTSVLFDKKKFGGKIIDFNYGQGGNTFVKTESTYYRNQITNNECLKYADVDCIYAVKEDNYLNKYKNKILGYNGNMLILNDGKVLSYSSEESFSN